MRKKFGYRNNKKSYLIVRVMDEFCEDKECWCLDDEIFIDKNFFCQENHPLTYSDEAIPEEYIWKVEMSHMCFG